MEIIFNFSEILPNTYMKFTNYQKFTIDKMCIIHYNIENGARRN